MFCEREKFKVLRHIMQQNDKSTQEPENMSDRHIEADIKLKEWKCSFLKAHAQYLEC